MTDAAASTTASIPGSAEAAIAAVDIGALNARHGIAGVLDFHRGPGGLPWARVHNGQASASVCLQGAQVTAWQPHDQAHPVLWLSPAARYLAGKPIRGGIPVCWPWFGTPEPPAQGAAGAAPPAARPAHGFARNQLWTVHDARQDTSGATELTLALTDSPASRALWPGAFALALRVRVGASLALALETRNTGTVPLHITEALHTYFHVGDIGAVAVHGLAGAAYFDAVLAAAGAAAAAEGCTHAGAVRFTQEVDRVYASSAACTIEDAALGRRIGITKSASASTVVWNPWAAKAERLGDLGAGDARPGTPTPAGWRQMLCVESGNARAAVVAVAPGTQHVLGVEYRVAG